MSGEQAGLSLGAAFVDETARLEAEYWRLLRFYPPAWREHRGAEMVSVLLDVAMASGRGRPTRRDRMELFAFGLLARWEALFNGAPWRLRDRVADLSSVLLFGVTACMVAFGEVPAWRAEPPPHPWIGMGPTTGQGPLAVLLTAFVCRVVGYRVTAQILFLIASVLSLGALVVGKVFGLDRPPGALMVALFVAALMAGCSAPMRWGPQRGWLGLAGAAFAGYLLLFFHLTTPLMMLEPYIVSLSFYFLQTSSILASAVLWVSLPMFVVTLAIDAIRRNGRLAVVVGVAFLPWWGFWTAGAATQLWESIGLDRNTELALLATVLAMVATGVLVTRRRPTVSDTDRLRPRT